MNMLFTSRSANCNSLPFDVCSTFEGPPVWLIGSTSEDYLWCALQIPSSSSYSLKGAGGDDGMRWVGSVVNKAWMLYECLQFSPGDDWHCNSKTADCSMPG